MCVKERRRRRRSVNNAVAKVEEGNTAAKKGSGGMGFDKHSNVLLHNYSFFLVSKG